MQFLNREAEIGRLDALVQRGGGLAVVVGRRRIGKTRLLVEWSQKHAGAYTVADQSAAEVQRRYFAEAFAPVFPGFADVTYPDWRSLLTRLSREARATGWRGPVIFDELPYLVVASPDLPAVLQRWVDHDAGQLVVVVAGSSQRMMHGLALAADAPLYGRAQEILHLQPLDASWLETAFPSLGTRERVETWAAWGGVPRYWELARDVPGTVEDRVDHLVLDPLGPLHREPDRLIAEELPPAAEVRGLLDAIGNGAHRVSEIAGRLGRPATSLARPLQRLQDMGLVVREVPFGDDERRSKRSLYRIADPFTRLWFRLVAPHRAQLAVGTPEARRALFRQRWPALLGEAWEALVRDRVSRLGPWGPAARWWQGNAPEWDVVARSVDGRRVLLGEAKLRTGDGGDVRTRPPPPGLGDAELVRARFTIDGRSDDRETGVLCFDATDLVLDRSEG
ncbi:MAG: ATP-binding protein [Deltaproteobacteria bacterium]|nr:ATP-binding protein [Deltaproteobacteria bacterium]